VKPGVGVTMRTSRGAAGPAARDEQITSYRRMLDDESESIRALSPSS
jgi:argininosuccinate lyase